jgi:predicted O-methyltransferase YrrM
MQMSGGFVISQCLFAAARLGIADLLKTGPQHCDELARVTDTDSDALYCLLRALAGIGIFAESAPKCFQLTPLAACLQQDEPGSLRNFILLRAELYYGCWGNFMHSLRTGQSAFEYMHGMNLFQYLEKNPAADELFNRAMTEVSALDNAAILAVVDLSSVEKIVDVGGGQGAFLATLLQHYPSLTGVLFDRSQPIEKARSLLKREGVLERCELVVGDFFTSVPAGGHTYVLKSILRDWDDQHAMKILQSCHQAMAGARRLLVMDIVVSPNNASRRSNFFDLAMLVLHSGRSRTTEEYRQLLESARFKLTKITSTTSETRVIEAVAY